MTEVEWLESKEPWQMLTLLRKHPSSRKSRLLMCAFCRQSWPLFVSEGGARAVEIGEKFADGLGSRKELRIARREALNGLVDAMDWRDDEAEFMLDRFNGFHFEDELEWVCRAAVRLVVVRALAEVVSAHHLTQVLRSISSTHAGASGAEDCGLIRDIFGNPFRPVAFSLSWRTDTVVSLAAQMYDSRDFSTMPILADALQDAGCDRAEILDHCRGDGPHVRGCWVVDSVLGKE